MHDASGTGRGCDASGSEACRGRSHRGAIIGVAGMSLAGLIWGMPVHAQMITPFPGYRGPALTHADMDAASAAADKLLRRDPASVGTSESWAGPTSGNRGTLTIRKVFEHAGMPCRIVTSRITYKPTKKRTKTGQEFTLQACRTANGQWKLVD